MKLSLRLSVLLFVLAVTPRAFGQWHSDSTTNTPVCTATNIQASPRACTDGADGMIVVWEDLRSGTGYDIYAQRIGADGMPKWTTNGVAVCTNTGDQKMPLIAPDGSGGAYVVWEDYRTLANGVDLYGQHIKSDGTLSYAAAGAPVSARIRDQHVADLETDEAGGAYVAWEDDTNSVVSSRPDIWLNRLTSSGVAWGNGIVVNRQSSQQHRPRICADGSGGCYVAFENNATVPTSIWAQRVSSSGTFLWTAPNGILVFKGASSTESSKNIDVRRDGNELMIAWEVTNPSSSSGQDILANRIHSDSTKVWYSPAEVTGDWYGNQTLPKVFSDDSAGTSPSTNKGLLVLFNDYQDNLAPNYYEEDLALVRVLPDGASRMPSYSNGFYFVCKKPHGQVGFKAVKVEDGKLLTVWNDARWGSGDTSIYAQCVDRTLKRYFPTPGTSNQWGLPVSVRTNYQAKQVTLVPRSNGGIAAWTDYRNGNYDIYAQLIFKDGTLPIELTNFEASSHRAGEVDLFWKTANEKGNAGFEIQRRAIADGADNGYTVVSSYMDNAALLGNGTTSTEHSYAYTDRNVQPGIYEYRLIDIGLDGSRNAHAPKRVDTRDIQSTAWAVGAVHPNPGVGRVELPVSLPMNAVIDVTLFDATGRAVAEPIQHQHVAAGEQSLTLDLTNSALTAGAYAIRVTALDASSGSVVWQSAKSEMLQIVK